MAKGAAPPAASGEAPELPSVELGTASRQRRTTLRAAAGQLWRRLRGGRLTPARAASSVAVGLFVGCLPLYGLHFPLCLLIGLPLGLDVVIAYLAANISNPLMAPLLWMVEIQAGAWLLTGQLVPLDLEAIEAIGPTQFAVELAVGSLIVGPTLAVLGAAVTWALVPRRRAAGDELTRALRRTTQRYRQAPPADRAYVAIKLRTDPIVSALASLEGSFGVLVDVGAGRGQLSLLLADLGRAEQVWGFDWDARKVEVATRAAGDDARFVVEDARDATWLSADTVLMADVLHYLPPADQRVLLERAASSLRPGGRLLVREVQARRGLRSAITRAAERVGGWLGYNRSQRMHFVTQSELQERLEGLGLECTAVEASAGPLCNVLVVGRRGSAYR